MSWAHFVSLAIDQTGQAVAEVPVMPTTIRDIEIDWFSYWMGPGPFPLRVEVWPHPDDPFRSVLVVRDSPITQVTVGACVISEDEEEEANV